MIISIRERLISKRLVYLFVVISILLFYSWIYFVKDDDWLRMVGASIFTIVGGTVGFILLYRTYRYIQSREKYFWLLLCCGVFFYISSNFVWFCFLVATGKPLYPNVSSYLWLVSYLFFLGALIYMSQIISMYVTNSHYVFNIVVFITIANAVSVQYFIDSILEFGGNVLSISFKTLAYPMLSLSIMFVTTTLYFLSKRSRIRKQLKFIIIVFYLQILADAIFVYNNIQGSYDLGGYIDPLWLLAILFKGSASLDIQPNQPIPEVKEITYEKTKGTIFPYLGIIFLLILVILNNEWEVNALNIGICILFLLVIVRQFTIMKQNDHLMSEYRFLAYHDPLTLLKNRASFKLELAQMMESAEKKHHTLALLLIDLDRFKMINDTLGHHIGDNLLVLSAKRLKDTLPSSNEIYRLGGDEFTIIIPNTNPNNCIITAEKILEEFSKPFVIDEYEISITPSIGISTYPNNGTNADELMKNADAAMYLAKANGKNNFQFFNSELNRQLERKVAIEHGLRKALEENELSLYYQPKVDLHSGRIIGSEALLRWNHPEFGLISPNEFIPIAEETGDIAAIGDWVLQTACKQNRKWQKMGFPFLTIAVNVSARQFQQQDFLKKIHTGLQEIGYSPKLLELEITESIMQNIKESTEMLKSLKATGIKTAIDDFGTGYSSLFILKELPIDTIKIDKAFIDDIKEAGDYSMVRTIINMGLNLNLEVVAEGIEDEFQAEVLAKNQCNYGQGYLYSKPVQAHEFEQLLIEGLKKDSYHTV
ncbi:EAL domain-containing protein [Lederbergia graminis]|uniref:EAL domain-containing protein n=1 Tax=Lederbergia graminis TaxID=735518 RepID=A0ABW0LKF5_9BACI